MSIVPPVVLIVLDGFGHSEETAHNAIAAARTPHWTHWWDTQPHALLDASGTAVGLPSAQMGNSEVGHMHIGCGRLIQQDYTRINNAIDEGDFFKNPVFLETIEDVQTHGNALHVMGLLSPGGVHSHENHLFAFLKLCRTNAYNNIYLHLFLDGRDTPPRSANKSIDALEEILISMPNARIVSITGRYYAMDRDNRWERISPVYKLLTEGKSTEAFTSARAALETFYEKEIFDEFIPPTRIGAEHPIKTGDAVFFFNFRADRARQLTEALISSDFSSFQRHVYPQLSSFISMTKYSDDLLTRYAFPPQNVSNSLGEILAQHHLRQLRIAETEKYAHVTFFFNGGIDKTFSQEQRVLIPSPPIATYDLQPEMSARLITQRVIDGIREERYDFIVCNFANADMVGHTGNFDATIRAIECLDECLATIWEALQPVNGHLLITADHGNAECMFDEVTHQIQTAHTCCPVPFVYLGKHSQLTRATGTLADIAPTVLTLLGITPPKEMTGTSLVSNND